MARRAPAGDGVVERDQLGVDVVLDAGQRQHVEHALAHPEHVDQLVAVAQHDLRAADDDVRRGDVAGDVLAEVGEHVADRLQADPGVEEGLDHPELEQVAVRVGAPAAAARRLGQRRPQQVGAGPVVELAIGDADDLGGLRAAVPGFRAHAPTPPCLACFVPHRRSYDGVIVRRYGRRARQGRDLPRRELPSVAAHAKSRRG